MPLHKSIQFSFLSVFEWQIYAEAESRANLFAMPKRYSICSRQAKYTQKLRAMQEAEGECKLVCVKPRSFALPKRYSICSRQAKYTQKLRAKEIYLHCRSATVYVDEVQIYTTFPTYEWCILLEKNGKVPFFSNRMSGLRIFFSTFAA